MKMMIKPQVNINLQLNTGTLPQPSQTESTQDTDKAAKYLFQSIHVYIK